MRFQKILAAAMAAALTVAMSVPVLADTVNQTGWWTAWTPGYELADGATLSFSADLTGGPDNWQSLNTAFVNVATDGVNAPSADNYDGYVEYAVVRTDNWGWGDCYNADAAESNWDWDAFGAMIADCHYEVTITRSGSTVTETLNVEGANGTSGYQKYTINVTGDDVYVFFTGDDGVSFTINQNAGEAPAEAEAADETAADDAAATTTVAKTADVAPTAGIVMVLCAAALILLVGRKRSRI